MNIETWKHCLATAAVMLAALVSADEPKNYDFDVIRDEASVPPYQLPPALASAEGKPITTPEEWFNVCRPQIIHRALRSGAWFLGNNKQSAGHFYSNPQIRYPTIGFRVARPGRRSL